EKKVIGSRLLRTRLRRNLSRNAMSSGWDIHTLIQSARPANFERLGRLCDTKNSVARILGPIPSAKANLVTWAELSAGINQSQNGADGLRIFDGAFKMHSQAWLGACIPIQLGLPSVLAYYQIKAAVMIEIAKSGAAGFTINRKTALPGRHCDKTAV